MVAVPFGAAPVAAAVKLVKLVIGSVCPVADGVTGLVVQAFPGGQLVEGGSPDERLVEDDGPVLVLSTAGAPLGCAVGCPVGRVDTPCHTLRVGPAGSR